MKKQFPKKDEYLIRPTFTNFTNRASPVRLCRISEMPLWNAKPRYEDSPSIWICIKGKITIHTENETFPCTPGRAVIIPPGTMYCPELFDEKFLIFHISFRYDAYKDVDYTAYINSITHLLLQPFSQELGFTLSQTVTFTSPSFEQAISLLETPSLINIERFFSLPEFSLTSTQKSKALSLASSRLLPILRAMTYIQENFALKITAEKLVQISGLCRTNLFAAFKKYLGISPTVYHVMIRVARAQYAITHTRYSLQYISDMCGFATRSHMSKCYKRYKNILPRHDRAKLKIFRERYPYVNISHNYFFDER